MPDGLKTISEIALYIHIPFCYTKCDYCDFYSVPIAPYSCTVFHYLEKLSHQIQFYWEHLQRPLFSTIYIGGGTPSTISTKEWEMFLGKFHSLLTKRPIEWTIEANTDSLTKEHLNLFNHYGINRLSIGVQSFQPNVLKTIGRGTHVKSIFHTLNMIKEEWKGQLNIDLMYSIPGETIKEAEEDINRTISFDPDHISLYALTVEENTPLFQKIKKRKKVLPAVETAEKMWERCNHLLHKSGYTQYEISNYAKGEKISHHNMGYWKLEPYMGIGPSGVSTLKDYSDSIIRLTNVPNLLQWMRYFKGRRNIYVEHISPPEFFFEHLIMGFRTCFGVKIHTLKHRFGVTPQEVIPKTLEKYQNMKMLEATNVSISLTTNGRRILNSFLRDALEEVNRFSFSSTINWP